MLKAKVADTPSAVEQGLMFVKDMPDDEGMLFMFHRAQKLSFWGRNTYIPLDIAFIDHNNTIKKIATIKPFSLNPISCDDKCVYAIEANAGYFEANGVKTGDQIEIDRPSFKDDAVISFVRTSKDSSGKQGKIKESQLGGTVQPPIVPNTSEGVVGQPIAQEPPQETMDDQNLPVLDTSDLGQYLEDGYDQEEQGVQDGLDGHIDQPPQPDTDDSTQEQQEYPVFENVFDAIDWSEQNLEVVRINYTTKKGRALIRDVEPHGKFHSQTTSKEILVTYDETVDGIRAFIVGNIGNWAFVGRKFTKKFVVKK